MTRARPDARASSDAAHGPLADALERGDAAATGRALAAAGWTIARGGAGGLSARCGDAPPRIVLAAGRQPIGRGPALAAAAFAHCARRLAPRGHAFDFVLGEPPSPGAAVVLTPAAARDNLAGTLRWGAAGALFARVRVVGVQGHVAYPDQVVNPVHAATALIEVPGIEVIGVESGTGATNVVPGHALATIRAAPDPAADSATLESRIGAAIDSRARGHAIEWFGAPGSGAALACHLARSLAAPPLALSASRPPAATGSTSRAWASLPAVAPGFSAASFAACLADAIGAFLDAVQTRPSAVASGPSRSA